MKTPKPEKPGQKQSHPKDKKPDTSKAQAIPPKEPQPVKRPQTKHPIPGQRPPKIEDQ